MGHRTRFRENGDLPPWRGSDAKKKPPFFNARALMAREIMRSRVLVNDLTAFSFIQVRDSRPNMVCLTSNPD